MTFRGRRLFRNPLFLVCLTAFCTAFLVQSGELGSSDTTHRLQTTHSFWTHEPPVLPDDYPEFGIHGKNGKLYSWYGIGQSLLMLPADVIGTWVEDWPSLAHYNDDPSPRDIVVSYLTNILLCVLTAWVCYRLLGRLGFTVSQQIAGVFALLFCTTFLHYTQDLMENNYILLLTLTGLTFQYEWLQTGRRRALLIGSAALGLNLLTRVTTAMDLLAVGGFLALVAAFTATRDRGRPGAARGRFAEYAKVALPVYAAFGLLDRLYQHHRFGSYFNTYTQIFGQEQKKLNPALPTAFPFETPFHAGFFGALFRPEKSIFLFDPLLLLTILIVAVAWRRLEPEMRAYLIAFGALVLAYIAFYAKYTDWSGDYAWGDRYVSTAVQIVAFISVPLWMRHRAALGKVVWRTGIALIAASALIQLASVMFWCPLEIYQMDTLGHPTFVVALRVKNIVAFSAGKMDQWGLINDAMQDDPYDYAHITTFYFLPFLLARVGAAAAWVVQALTIVWFAVLGGLLLLLNYIRGGVRRGRFEPGAATLSAMQSES